MKLSKSKQLILASASPRRKKLLEQIGLIIKVVPSNIDEKLNPRLKPKAQAEQLSLQKAQAVAKTTKDAIIIAADTLVIIENEILGKPKDQKDARRMLKKLRNRKHSVITGYTILDTETKKVITTAEETFVHMKKLSDKEIDAYIKTKEPFDKAGAYAINERGSLLMEKIHGDFFNVVGLPLRSIADSLKKFGIDVL